MERVGKRNPTQSFNIAILNALQTYGKESAVSNLGAATDFVLTATGYFHFCTHCHRMLPVSQDVVAVSH